MEATEEGKKYKINSSESFTLTNLHFDSKKRLLLTENRDKKDMKASLFSSYP